LEEINHQLVTRTDYESDEYSKNNWRFIWLYASFWIIRSYNYVGDTENSS
jgi:ATP-binding cassette subfamily F protein 3